MTKHQFIQYILPTKNKLFRFALSYVGNEADAKDIVQEVMLTAWEQLHDPHTVRNIEAWCMTLTRNKSLNLLKKKGRHYLDIEEQRNLCSNEVGPQKLTEVNEAANNIRKIIRSLPEKQREVIQLRDVEGYSYKEITEILHLEMGHVKVLLFRARKKIKLQLMQMNNYGVSRSE